MKNSARPHALFVALAAVGLAFAATSCSSDDPETMPINPGDATDSISATAYVVAATVDGTSYLLTASSLSEGTLSVKGHGTEVNAATYWVFKGQKYLFGLVYNQGGNGTGASYYLDAAGTIREKYLYEYNRITTYGTWGQHVVTASTGSAPATQADAEGNLPQVLLFNLLNAEDGSQTTASVMAENFLGNGEKVHMAGLAEADGRLYASVIPGGMSRYGIARWPQCVTDPALIATADGGSASSAYTAGEIPSTQYPDSAYVAIYTGDLLRQTPYIARTGRIGYACGRYRSQYYQTIWPADNGDLYVFSPGYGRTVESTDDLKRVVGTKPSGVVRIKAGQTTFDDTYYVNLEALGTQHPMFRCWHISGDSFLLQLYRGGVDEMKKGKEADVSELAIFHAEARTLIPVTGLPDDLAGFGGEPYGENGKMYIAVSVTGGDYPAFYEIDAATGRAVKGLTVEADALQTAGVLEMQR